MTEQYDSGFPPSRSLKEESKSDSEKQRSSVQQTTQERAALMQELAPQFGLELKVLAQPGEKMTFRDPKYNRENDMNIAEGYLGIKLTIPNGAEVSDFYNEVDRRLEAQKNS